MTRPTATLGIVLVTLMLATQAAGQTPAGEPESGGVLRLVHREDLPQAFAIHESSTNSVTWPAMPCYRNLVFFLRRDVRWHDSQPFTSKDVKFTFDIVREAKDAPAKLRLNPRKEWYTNVEAIDK